MMNKKDDHKRKEDMQQLMKKLKKEFHEELEFRGELVAWDKILLLILRDLGYDLKLEDYATKVILYNGEHMIGQVPYKVEEMEADGDHSERYNVMYLDFLHTIPPSL